MGWLSDQYGGEHEGYVIALITREGPRGSGVYRALCSPDDRADFDIERLGTECTCGWRSSHWTPLARVWTCRDGERMSLEWMPFSAIVSPPDDERAYQEWRGHIAQISAHEAQGDTSYPQLRVVPRPVESPDDPSKHLCVTLNEASCWLQRHPNEDGRRVRAQPCDAYRPYCSAPEYCWCGHARARHNASKSTA